MDGSLISNIKCCIYNLLNLDIQGKKSGNQLNEVLMISLLSQITFYTYDILDTVMWGIVHPAPIVWAIWGLSLAIVLR